MGGCAGPRRITGLTQALRDRLTSLGATVVGSTPAEFADYVRNDLAKWTRVVKQAGIKPD